MEPHSMAMICAGSLAKCGKNAYSGPTKGLKGYLSFYWHGAHDKGEGNHRDNDVLYYIANEVNGGIFDIMFCSVSCLRSFINFCLDDFENKVNNLKPLV